MLLALGLCLILLVCASCVLILFDYFGMRFLRSDYVGLFWYALLVLGLCLIIWVCTWIILVCAYCIWIMSDSFGMSFFNVIVVVYFGIVVDFFGMRFMRFGLCASCALIMFDYFSMRFMRLDYVGMRLLRLDYVRFFWYALHAL